MGSSEKLNLNIETLKWARENAGLEPNDVSLFTEERIKNFEEGEDKPTLKEANSLSQAYGVSFHMFYYSPPKTKLSDITDFRKLPKTKLQKYSPNLRLLINKLKQRQDWLRDHLKENKEKPLPFVNSKTLNSNPQNVANNIVKTFFNSREEYYQFHKEVKDQRSLKKNPRKFLSSLITKVARHGIIVLKCKGFKNDEAIELEEARGFILVDKYAPFIFINSADQTRAQIFTLMHELAHLFLGKEGVVGNLNKENHNRIETFCNQVASRVLLTGNELKENFSNGDIEKDIIKISNKFFISKLSILLRLKETSVITNSLFKQMWISSNEEIKSFLKKKASKLKMSQGGNYYNTKLTRTNRQFVKIVYNAYRSKSITGSQASSLLNVKINQLQKSHSSQIRFC